MQSREVSPACRLAKTHSLGCPSRILIDDIDTVPAYPARPEEGARLFNINARIQG